MVKTDEAVGFKVKADLKYDSSAVNFFTKPPSL
jgi:hypothetical protein